MNNFLLKLFVKMQGLVDDEEGQDLVEYALVVAMIALAATAGMRSFASGVNTAFTNLSSKIGTTVS